MFEQSLIADAVKKQSPWTFAASLSVQCLAVGAALAISVMHVTQLDTRLANIVYLPLPLGKPELKPQPVQRRPVSSTTILQRTSARTYRPFIAPTRIPDHVATGPELPNAPAYDFGGTLSSGAGGVPGGIELPGLYDPAAKLAALAPQAAVATAKSTATEKRVVRIGGGVQEAKLIFSPRPVYPPLAKQARISGVVRLAADIAPDGRIRNLRVLSGHPMLTKAALDAVSQWRYRPTLLNDEPVEVLTEVFVNFVLNP